MKIKVNTYGGAVCLLACMPDNRILCETETDYVVWSYHQEADLSINCTNGDYYPKFKYDLDTAIVEIVVKYDCEFIERNAYLPHF